MWNIRRQKCRAKGSGKQTTIQEVMDRDKTNVGTEMQDDNSNIWSHQTSNKRFKEEFGSRTRKTLRKLNIRESYTWNTLYIIWKVLQPETGNLNDGDHRWFKRSSRMKRSVTKKNTYEMRFVLGFVMCCF
jgi:hypothetical protein